MTQSFAERITNELADHDLGTDVRTHIDAWLKADKDFNVWFLETTKSPLADDDLMALLDGYRESQETAEQAWERFTDGNDGATLIAAMMQSIARMKTLQGA